MCEDPPGATNDESKYPKVLRTEKYIREYPKNSQIPNDSRILLEAIEKTVIQQYSHKCCVPDSLN